MRKTVGGRTIQFTEGEDFSAVASAHMVFISQENTIPADEVLSIIKSVPVLTVADMEGCCRAGGMITLVIINNKVQLGIHHNAAKEAGLKKSS